MPAIAFSYGGRIHVMAPDGSRRVRLTGGRVARRLGGDSAPTWSPDGETLAFVRSFEGGPLGEVGSRIYLLGADGGRARRLSPLEGGQELDPAWSPDGRRIAFVRGGEEEDHFDSAIVVAELDGGGQRIVHTEPPDGPAQTLSDVAWSPDGARIAYTRTVTDRRFHFRPSLYVVDAYGGAPQLLAREAGDAAWSPDGRRIAFASVRDRNGKLCFEQCSYRTELYVMDADGSDPFRLTRDRGDDESPTWSPDGRRIAFASDRSYPDGEASEIYSIRADGSCLAALTNGAPQSVDPAWSGTAARPSDPERCGPTGREPLVEVGLPRVRGPERFPLYWLGERYRTQLLSATADGYDDVALFYRDCASFSPRACPPPLQIQETSVCSRRSVLTVVDDPSYRPVRAFVAHGRLVVDLGQGDLTVIAGETDVRIFPDARSRRRANRRALAAVRSLRPVGERRARLPVTALPRYLLRRLRSTEHAHHRPQFAAAVRSLPRIRPVSCR